MKKLFLPLILILLLAFALTGYSADLFGTYDQRIKLTVDETKIDTADLTWFPVTVFLTSTAGEEVFAEFDADADYLKVAFTKSDGVTELYAEMELFDDGAQVAIYHVSLDGWVINYDADTDFYMYYDNDVSDNTDFIGAINTTAGAAVWDGNFELVCHMVDDAGGEIDDSTSNSNDGTKTSANNPLEVAGQISFAQTFSSDKIIIANETNFDFERTDPFSISFWVKTTAETAQTIIAKQKGVSDYSGYGIEPNDGGKILFFLVNAAVGNKLTRIRSTNTVNDDGWHHVLVLNGGNDGSASDIKIYIDGDIETPDVITDTLGANSILTNESLRFGSRGNDAQYFDGTIDESRIASVARAAEWAKAEYNSGNDSLLTYGAEETPAAGIVWNGVTITKWNGVTITIPINTQ